MQPRQRRVSSALYTTPIPAAELFDDAIPRFAPPDRRVGHESQIESWLTPSTALLARVRNRKRRHIGNMNLQKRKKLKPRSIAWAGWQEELLRSLQSWAKCFFLTSPFIERGYRRSPSTEDSTPIEQLIDLALPYKKKQCSRTGNQWAAGPYPKHITNYFN